jgi:hypothetical protein
MAYRANPSFHCNSRREEQQVSVDISEGGLLRGEQGNDITLECGAGRYRFGDLSLDYSGVHPPRQAEAGPNRSASSI